MSSPAPFALQYAQERQDVNDGSSFVVVDGISSDTLPDRVLSFLNAFW
jgi:hypothetical protein